MTHDSERSLYERLGGYDAISAVAHNLVARLQTDAQLGRFWQHRGDDGVAREVQLLVDFLCTSAGGPMYYTGRDMALAHKGMRIGESDWASLRGHVTATLAHFQVPESETQQVLAFIESTKADIVEVA